jgi:hypothetical protein
MIEFSGYVRGITIKKIFIWESVKGSQSSLARGYNPFHSSTLHTLC